MNFLNQMFFVLGQANAMGTGSSGAGKVAAVAGKAGKAAAHGSAQHQGNPMYSLVLIVVMILVFWLLLIRPQQKQRKKQESFLGTLKLGDQVYTNSGIIGRITAIDDAIVTMEIARDTRIKVIKSQVGGYFKPGETPKMNSDKR